MATAVLLDRAARRRDCDRGRCSRIHLQRVYEGRPGRAFAWLRPARARALPRPARRSRARHGLGSVRAGRALVLARLGARAVRAPARAGRAAAQPRRTERRPPRPRVQHGGLVRDQHELAVLLARADDELPHADDRAGRAELRLGRGRHGRGGRDGARLLPLGEPRHRQLLGRPRARHALRADPARARPRRRARRARRRRRRSTARRTCRRSSGATQTIARGPFASQEAIKELGTNGGGSFNANSAHPYENPTPFTNLLEIWSLLLIPFAMPFLYGRMLGRAREGIAILAAMVLLLGTAFGISLAAETRTTPALTAAGLTHAANMEGKEQRFSVQEAAIFSDATTGTSTGAVNSMHDSFTAIGGAVPMTMILLGEVAPGRRRHRALLDPAVRHADGVHRRPDGRAHAGVPGQVDRRARGQARDARRARHAGRLPRSRSASRRCSTTAWPARSTPVRTASARSSTRSPRPGTTTARPSPG